MAEEHEGGNGKIGVSFTIKELLANLDTKIDRIESKLDSKVDIVVTDALRVQINALDAKIQSSEAVKVQADEIGKVYLRQWEAMQKDIADMKTAISVVDGINKDRNNWKVLWIPAIFGCLGVILLAVEQYIIHVA